MAQSTTLNAPESSSQFRLWRIAGLSLFAIVFGGTAARIAPGGPFVSLTSDILPIIAALTSIRYSLQAMRGRDTGNKLIAAFFMLICVFALSNVVRSILLFWFRPYASGDLFGL